ncbi:unnamed protein product [Fusarium graminearum]|nr:unnamed protein product [Fusarium graminearum]CAG1989861.1 unnamed protein product [Fusarium graminearum]VTO87885.1 unnamed protein product [Fusarium graminearum]
MATETPSNILRKRTAADMTVVENSVRRDSTSRESANGDLERGSGPSIAQHIAKLMAHEVYALEAIVKSFHAANLIVVLNPPVVPISRWIFNIVLFFTINLLNNHAFSYDISVPVHIILRSGGSITTMAAGYLYGKRYTQTQVIAVFLLTLGVILAAWSDAQAKGTSESSGRPAFSTGLLILFVAQVLSAIMGLYTEATYAKYGPQWKENLFYSHALSLPLFLPFAPSMVRTFSHLMTSTPIQLPGIFGSVFTKVMVPNQIIFLITNVLTQYACIRGVNLLAAASTALTVTIVLNIRKLVSLLLSIWLFGNQLASGTLLGAVIVFSAGGLYTVGSRRKVPAEKDMPARDQKAS